MAYRECVRRQLIMRGVSTIANVIITRAYIKMQLTSMAKNLRHRTKESKEADK